MCLYVNTIFVDSFITMYLTYGCSGSLSWEQLLRNARLRKTYVSLYASLLKSDMSRLVVDDHEEIKRMDRELDMEVILQWRWCASILYSVHLHGDYLQMLSGKAGSSVPWWSVQRFLKECDVEFGKVAKVFPSQIRTGWLPVHKRSSPYCTVFPHLPNCPFPWKTVKVH